jgi:hypothetical protein
MVSPSGLRLQHHDVAGSGMFKAVEVVRWGPLANTLVKSGPPTAAVLSEENRSEEKGPPARRAGASRRATIHHPSSVRLFRQQRLFL